MTELHALLKEDLTPVERLYVRRSIEQHKLGTNKTLLRQVGAPAAGPGVPVPGEHPLAISP